MSSQERFTALTARSSALIAAKQQELDRLHPRFAGALAELKAGARAAYDPGGIVLGRDGRDRPLVLPERPRLEHMHVIGATGSGKTNLLEHMIRQDITLGRGVLVIDPHGNHPNSLYRSLLAWIGEQGWHECRPVHLVDPNATGYSVGFNPLAQGGGNTAHSVIAEATFEAFERLWGDEDGNSKPTIQRVLTATFTALAEQQLTLAEARLLFDPNDRYGIRALVLQNLEDGYAYDELEWLHQIGREKGGRRDFRAEVVGPINRIAKLVRSQAVRAIVGQNRKGLDLRKAMDEGHIILCNLSGGSQVYEQGADLLGRLLTRFVFFHARRRRHPERLFVAYLDECHRYLSGDIPNMLAEVRKHGVALVAANQWLAQLGRPDDPVREAMCKGPNIKVIFRIKDPREAAELAEAVIPLNLEMPVQALIKPTVVGHNRTRFRNASTALSRSETVTTGRSRSVSESEAHGTSYSGTESESISETEGTTVSDGDSDSSGTADTSTWAESNSSGHSAGQADSTAFGREPYGGPLTLPTSRTDTRQTSSGRDEANASMRGGSHNDSSGHSHSHAVAETSATTVTQGRSETFGTSYTKTHGETRGQSTSHGETRGVSESSGYSEGIEPIYRDLPSTVHSKENVLYLAAQELLSLTTGSARIAYVGPDGRVATQVRVPRVRPVSSNDGSFDLLRAKILAQSDSAVPMKAALAELDQREQSLIAKASQKDEMIEPKTFRVPTRRGSDEG